MPTHIECKLKSMDRKEVDNGMVEAAIKEEVKVAELVDVVDKLSAITAVRSVTLQEFVRILL